MQSDNKTVIGDIKYHFGTYESEPILVILCLPKWLLLHISACDLLGDKYAKRTNVLVAINEAH